MRWLKADFYTLRNPELPTYWATVTVDFIKSEVTAMNYKEGWVCPKCGAVHAPWIPGCDCYKQKQQPMINQPTYESAPYWTNPLWKAPVITCIGDDIHLTRSQNHDNTGRT